MRTGIVDDRDLRAIFLVERLRHVVVDVDDERAGSGGRRIVVGIFRGHDRREVEEEIVLGARNRVVELVPGAGTTSCRPD